MDKHEKELKTKEDKKKRNRNKTHYQLEENGDDSQVENSFTVN